MLIYYLVWKLWILLDFYACQTYSLRRQVNLNLTVYPNFIVPILHFKPKNQFLSKFKGFKSLSDDNLSTIIEDTLNASVDYESNNLNNNNDIININIDNGEKNEYWNEYARNLIKKTYKDQKEKNIGAWKIQTIKGFDILVKPNQCPGCGITLQYKNNLLPGFIELKEFDNVKLNDSDNSNLKLLPLCMRCKGFKGGNVLIEGRFLKNKDNFDVNDNFDNDNFDVKNTLDNDSNATLDNGTNDLAIGKTAIDASNETSYVLYNTLRKNYHRNVSIVYIMDALDLYLDNRVVDYVVNRRLEIAKRVKTTKEGTANSKLTLFYIVVNKMDLIPYDSRKRIICYVHKLFNDEYPELNLKPRHIFLTNSITGNGVNLFYSVLLHSAEILRSKVYFIGYANSGKSTLLNWLAKFANDTQSPVSPNRLATSLFPGTTLRPIKINIGKNYELYDTPGILDLNSLTSYLSVDNIRTAIPRKHKKPTVYRINQGESLLLGQFVRIDLEDSKPYFFTPFISGNIPVRVASRKRLCFSKEATDLSRMYPVYEYDQSGNKIPPKLSKVPAELENEEKMLVPKVFKIVGSGWKTGTVDICIKGLGFVSVAGALKATIKVYTNPNIRVTLRKPMFPKMALPF